MSQPLAEVITIGDEILYGHITDTNTQFISQQLALIGIKTIRKSSVPDRREQIFQILSEAKQRASIILVTGGLGPTQDDITKPTIADFFKTKLVIHEPTLQRITEFFEKRNRPLLEVNKKQAEIPQNAEAIANYQGTAPGIWIEEDHIIYIFMPGVPFEMKAMMEDFVVPKLKTRYQEFHILHKMIHTCGMGESFISEMIKEWENNLPQQIKLAYLPSLGTLTLRLTASGTQESSLKKILEEQTNLLSSLIESYIYGYDSIDTLQLVIAKMFRIRKLTLSTAESCTGGLIAHLLTTVPGSSEFYKGSLVAYSNEVKINHLKVSPVTLHGYGAVSEQTVKEMAEGARKELRSDVAVAVSGIAGPDGGSPEKPVGTVWIGYSDREKTVAKKWVFAGTRENIIKLSAIHALNFIRLNLT